MKYLAILVCALAGCQVSLPSATASDASRANIELADLQRGRSLLVTRCGSCHRPPMPGERRAVEWPDKLDKMTERANLDVAQRHLIESYLMTMASR
jgi:mono/diheme cytochrome c family protein